MTHCIRLEGGKRCRRKARYFGRWAGGGLCLEHALEFVDELHTEDRQRLLSDAAVAEPPDSPYIFFQLIPLQGRRTQAWLVKAQRDGAPLGTVGWFNRWRQYAFFPGAGTAFNPACMDDISKFCRDLTTAQRRTARERKCPAS